MANERNPNQSARTDRGSVVNPGSEDDELLNATDDGVKARASLDEGSELTEVPPSGGEVDQSGTRGARGKPGGTIVIPDRK